MEQISIFEYFNIPDESKPNRRPDGKMRTLNDWFKAERSKEEFLFDQDEMEHIQETDKFCDFYFLMGTTKCCNVYPILRHKWRGFEQLSYTMCPVCGRKTEPIDDYSWQRTKLNWEQMMESVSNEQNN